MKVNHLSCVFAVQVLKICLLSYSFTSSIVTHELTKNPLPVIFKCINQSSPVWSGPDRLDVDSDRKSIEGSSFCGAVRPNDTLVIIFPEDDEPGEW